MPSRHRILIDSDAGPAGGPADCSVTKRGVPRVDPVPSSLMKALLVFVALAMVTSSADAAQPRKRRPLAAPPSVAAYPLQRGANLFPPGPVMYGNQYLGNDPDPFIRLQIMRDLGAHFGGAD